MLQTLQSRIVSFQRLGLIILAFIAAFSVGLSNLLFPFDYTPLFVGGGILGIIILLIGMKHPSLALCFTLFIIFLPDGLLPGIIQSNLNRSLTVATFGIWLLDFVRYKRQIALTPTAILMIGFLLWSITTFFWTRSIDSSLHWMQVYILRFLLFLFLLPNMVRSEKDLVYLMKTLAISGWLLAFMSVISVTTTGYAVGSRLKVLGENENALGIALLISLIGVLWLAHNDRSRYKSTNKILSYIYLIIVIIITAFSGSRGSAISLVVTLLLFLLWKPTRRWGELGLFLIVLGLIIMPFVFTTTLERFTVIRGDTLLGGREAIWQAAWAIIQLQPWTGVGIGNAPNTVIPFLIFLRSVGGGDSVAIHNPILTIWAETGIPGLLLYISVLFSAIWVFLTKMFHNRKPASKILLYYFPVLAAVFIGYMFSWIKGGGMESDHTYFFMLSLLLIPSHLKIKSECP